MAIEKILLVEDNPSYLKSALDVLPSEGLIVARNYGEAMQRLATANSVITDLFYRENESCSSKEIGEKAIEKIKYGFVKDYIDRMNVGLVSRGLEPNERLEKCFYVLGLTQRGATNRVQLNDGSGILDYLKFMGDEGRDRLEEMIRNHCLIDGNWQRQLEGGLDGEMSSLRNYMKESPDNFPLGYLICEEAERLGKPAVLATSLRHSERAVGPIVASANKRGWKMLEGGDGNKDNPEYWMKAYNLLKGGEKNGKNN